MVQTGLDVLARGWAGLEGRRVGLVTHAPAVDRGLRSAVDVLAALPGVRLEAVFGPEHGFHGQAQDLEGIAGSESHPAGPRVVSLYDGTAASLRPTAAQLAGLDVLVVDLVDIGSRYYTFQATMKYCLEAAAPLGIGMLVLDLTLGELARLIAADRKLKLELVVVKCEGWRRADWWDATGLTWVNPSPNMRSLTQATLYPGPALLEFTNVSVGRGTDTPFELFGAPYIEPRAFAAALNAAKLPGIRFIPVRFTPRASKFAGETCGGVQLLITDRLKFQPVRTGLEMAAMLRRLHRDKWEASKLLTLLANRAAMDGLLADEPVAQLQKEWTPALKAFVDVRKHFLLYS